MMKNWPGKHKFSAFDHLKILEDGKKTAGKHLKKGSPMKKNDYSYTNPYKAYNGNADSYSKILDEVINEYAGLQMKSVWGSEQMFTAIKNKPVPVVAPMEDPMLGYDGCTCSHCVAAHVEDATTRYNAYVANLTAQWGPPVFKMPELGIQNKLSPSPELPTYDLKDIEVFGGASDEQVEAMTIEKYLKTCDAIAKKAGFNEYQFISREVRAIGKAINIDPVEWVTDKQWGVEAFHLAMKIQFGASYYYDINSTYGGYRSYVHGYARLWKYKVRFTARTSSYFFDWVYSTAPLELLEAYKDTVIPFLQYHGSKIRHLFTDSVQFNDVVLASNCSGDLREVVSVLLADGQSGESMMETAINLSKMTSQWPDIIKLARGMSTVKNGAMRKGDRLPKFIDTMNTLQSALNIGVPSAYVDYLLGQVVYENEENRVSTISTLLGQRRYFERVIQGLKQAGITEPEYITKVFYVVAGERPSFMSLRDPVAFVRRALASTAQPPENMLGKINDKIAQRSPSFAKRNWASEHTKGLKIGWMFKQVLEYMEIKTAEGHTFYIHGRDGEIVYQLARRSGRKISCKFAITSRSLGPTNKNLSAMDKEYSDYLKRVFPQKNPKSIHLDSGFSGSVPKWFHSNGWDSTSSFVLVGANEGLAAQYQLPYTNRAIDGMTHRFDNLASTYMEDINHRLVSPDKWGKLKFNESAGGFWAYIYGIEDSIKAEFPEFYNVKKPRSVGHVQQAAA